MLNNQDCQLSVFQNHGSPIMMIIVIITLMIIVIIIITHLIEPSIKKRPQSTLQRIKSKTSNVQTKFQNKNQDKKYLMYSLNTE